MPSPASRTLLIDPFYVMEVAKEAAALQSAGRSVIHLSIGEPDFTAPERVRRAAAAAIEAGSTQYTPAAGLTALRERIAAWYGLQYGLEVDPHSVLVTAGASSALLLACAALVNQGDEVLLPDPSYPCNRHFVSAFGGVARLLDCGPDDRFQLSAAAIEAAWGIATRGVLIASPSNPTGTSIQEVTLAPLISGVEARGGFVISDEIYQALSYDGIATTARKLSENAIVINSFSKYFNMTGWRLGWMLVPPGLMPTVEKLAQNLYICPSAIAQRAALACFDSESIAVYEERRAEFRRRRDFLVPALRAIGFGVPVVPDGAFYVYADVSAFGEDSEAFVRDLLHATGVCLVPGKDFGVAAPKRYVRISYATSYEKLQQAVERLRVYLTGGS
jgi:aspartate/methionine/tyrosine aminotransferase